MKLIRKADAEKKWCPFVAFFTWGDMMEQEPLVVSNRHNENNLSRCITTECMAWEEDEENHEMGICLRMA